MPPVSNKSSDPVLVDIITPFQFNQIFERFYPIGTHYSNEIDTRNPAQIFGFGTWVAKSGVFIVGKAASGTFATLRATGGAETVTLTTAQIPSHTHGFANTGVPSSYHAETGTKGYDHHFMFDNDYSMTTTSSTGGGGSHPNLPPYSVSNIWVRIA